MPSQILYVVQILEALLDSPNATDLPSNESSCWLSRQPEQAIETTPIVPEHPLSRPNGLRRPRLTTPGKRLFDSGLIT